MKLGKLGGTIAAIAVVGGIVTLGASAQWIPDGYAGVVVSVRNGAEDEAIGRGINFVNPTSKVKKFTIGNEQLLLTKDKREGSKDDDSFKVSTSDDANMSISFQMSYRFDPEKVVDTYKRFKGMDGESIVENRVKAVLKSKVSEVTTNYSMMDIYSGNRSEINNKLTEYLNDEFSVKYGIQVTDASIVDAHPDEKLKAAIDSRLTTIQKKQQAEAEQQKIKVEKETEQLQAEADAKIAITNAKAKAEKLRIEAEAQADANRKLAESLTPELIEKLKYEKWNGVLPQIQGSSTPIVDLNK